MDDLREVVRYYLDQLKEGDAENAYHYLIELDPAAVPLLIEAFRDESNQPIRDTLVELVWQYRLPDTIGFLVEVLDDSEPGVWKNALDGLVTIGGTKSIEALESFKGRPGLSRDPKANKLDWIDEAIQQIREGL